MTCLIFTIIIILILICLVISAFDMNRFVIRDYDVSFRQCKKDLRVVHISDLHNKSYGVLNSKLKKSIEGLQPDMIRMSGDIMTADRNKRSEENADDLVMYLAAKYPVYFSIGNHEERLKDKPEVYGDMYYERIRRYKDSGVHVLDNESEDIPEYGIRVTGLDIGRKYYSKTHKEKLICSDITDMAGNKDDDHLNLLLAHNPIYFKAYTEWGADLVLSGHIHGGIVRIPGIGGMLSPDVSFFPKYDGGIFKENGSVMIVSRGLGTHTIPIRVFDPGELVCIDVHQWREKHGYTCQT